ncbi:MAG: hypothetical protein JWO13_1389 [Acidobacteriales bacterium]|nr:hypothetical protein [Terriglobales bacterium]
MEAVHQRTQRYVPGAGESGAEADAVAGPPFAARSRRAPGKAIPMKSTRAGTRRAQPVCGNKKGFLKKTKTMSRPKGCATRDWARGSVTQSTNCFNWCREISLLTLNRQLAYRITLSCSSVRGAGLHKRLQNKHGCDAVNLSLTLHAVF